jgi:class 3 adenylate cyclase/tetratricopeptide (TPR) repeat protein
MHCPRCQHENRPSAKFCEECAAPLARSCPNCSAPLSPSGKFCPECAHPVAVAAVGKPRFASPESYTPRHLAERILTSKAALEGERKQVTVLFADLRGSMELLADRDPEEARKLLDPVLEQMMEAVHRYEGTVNQVMGDGIMALFGAPLSHEDHAIRAGYAALRMQESVKRYAEDVRRREAVLIQIRVGLNSGEVVVRTIGSDLRMDYTAIGQTTHLAARMEQIAAPGSTVMSAAALRLAEGYLQVKPLGSIHIKGLAEPVEAYEVTGAGVVRTRLQAGLARGLTRFVGRDGELEQLGKTLDRAREGHGQVVAAVGEAGVGKSRLFHEFVHSRRTREWLILESGSVSYGKATSYLPIVDLLKAYFKIQAGDDPRMMREKVTGKLLTLDEALRPMLPAFLALLDVAVEDPQWQALGPDRRRQRTLDAVKSLLLRESQVQPLLLVFEDLHWIDSETQALLDGLIESLPAARVLLLVNYRTEYQHGWGSKTYYTQLRLDTLPPESAGEILAGLLGGDPGLDSLTSALIARTGGNPFFLEESVRTLVETKALTGERGAYQLTRSVEALQVPATVQAILAARIDRLPLPEKQVLQSAAVVGKDAPFALLQSIADETEEGLRRALAHLQAAEFLYETSLFPDLEYSFKHALTHEVAYGTLLRERRRALHARIVEAIERLSPDRLAEHVDRLAEHALGGELWDRAATYFLQAGDKAFSRSAYREAVARFEQALVALGHLAETRDTIERAIDVRLRLRNPLWILAEYERIYESLREAEGLARGLGDPLRLGRASALVANYYTLIGDHDRAIDSCHRAAAAAEETGDFDLQFLATFQFAQAWRVVGDLHQAMALHRRNITALEGNLLYQSPGMNGVPSANSRAWLAWCLAERGEFTEAAVVGQEALRIAESVEHPLSMAVAHGALGHGYLRKGELSNAMTVLERSMEIARVWNLVNALAANTAGLAQAYALSGRYAEALAMCARLPESGGTWIASRAQFLAECHCLAGDIPEAVSHAQRALELACARKERGRQAWSFRLLGDSLSRQDPLDVERAEGYYRQAIGLGEELEMRPLLGHCHLGLGTLYRIIARRPEAQEHLTTAATMFREMDMRLWLEQAEAALGSLS